MIKVNLLRDQATQTKRAVYAPEVSNMGILLFSALGIIGLCLWLWWFYLDSSISELTVRREQLQEESQRLQALHQEIDKYEKLKQLTESRIDIIETLKENQTGPVLLMNHVIRSIPRETSIWLNLLNQKGDQVEIKGYALKSESIPDFMTNLGRTGIFETVDLEVIEDNQDAQRFALRCKTKQKEIPAALPQRIGDGAS